MNGFILTNKNMSKHYIYHIAFCLALLLGAAGPLGAQLVVKEIAVSQGTSFTDHIALAPDSRDTDVMVKFIFDESKNALKVCVLSYRNLFVFREASAYKKVIRGRRLRPELLPYEAASDEGVRYYLSKGLRKEIPSPRRSHVFPRWIEYDGLLPAPTDYKMVNDYIEQEFQIVGQRNYVTVTVHEVYLMEPDGGRYELLPGRNVETKYHIQIKRNPCFGLDKEIQMARSLKEEVKQTYQNFHQAYADGKVGTAEALKTFEQTQKVLLTQYPVKNDVSRCPDLESAIQQYNQYVDSIRNLSCKLVVPQDPAAWDDQKELDTKMIYSQVRQMDSAVSRWLVTKDQLERKDLVKQCKSIIEEVSAMIGRHRITTAEEQKAVTAFRQAEDYFRKTCKP